MEEFETNLVEFSVSELSGAIKRQIEDSVGRVRVRGGVGIGGSAILTKVFGWGCILALLGWGAAASMASWGARAYFCRLCCDLVNLCARYEMTQLRARTRDLRRRAGPGCIRASHVMFYSIVPEKGSMAMHSSVLHR